MGNQKENLKKSLGITDYPWSSDDDDDDDTRSTAAVEAGSAFRNDNDLANATRPSAQPQAPTSSVMSRNSNITKLERDLFWKMLHNPHRVAAVDPARPGPSSYQPNESGHGMELESKFSHIARINAINKLSRKVIFSHSNNYRNGPRLLAGSSLEKSRKLVTRSSRDDPSIDVIRPDSNLNPNTAHNQNPEANNSHSDDETDSRLRLSISPTPFFDENNENTNNAVEQPTENSPPEEAVVENDPDVEVIDNNGTDNVQPEERPNDQANEETNAANNVSEPSTNRQGVKRKADDHDDDIHSVREFNQSVLRVLECPVCMEWMEPPMSQCRRGHLVCGPCRARLVACPVCRTAFSSVRNRAMESVAELLRYPCRHGCGREARLRRRAAHEASCGARRYRCPVPACAERAPFPLADLHYHFQARHLPLLKVGRRHRFSMRVNAQQHDTWLVAAARELFHLRVDVDVGSWGLIVYVAYIGPRCNAKNFTYEVTVTGQHNSRKLVYTRTTHSDLESSTMNVNRQDCFHLTLDQALNFIRQKNRLAVPDKFLDFVVEINKREPPPTTSHEQSDS